MFYFILENGLEGYADYMYCDSCCELKGVSVSEYERNPNKYKVENNKLVLNPNYAQEQAEKREKQFKEHFFETSLGWIRRKVQMKDGTSKDFLSDLLLPIKAGLELGQKVEIIAYKVPDFTLDYTDDYIISLQERKQATPKFIQECLMQTVADFGG